MTPRDVAQRFRATLARQNVIFNLFLVLCTLAGVLSLFWAFHWRSADDERRQHLLMLQIGQKVAATTSAEEISGLLSGWKVAHGVWPDLVRDLGIALLIAVFVTLVIEKYASNRLREHIAYDVLSAAYAKVVPEKIYTQVADNVFRSDFYRRNWEVNIRTDDQTQHGDAEVVIQTMISYDIENLNEHRVSFDVSAGIDLDVVLQGRGIPRFKSIEVTGQHIVPVNAQITLQEAQAVLASPDSPPAAPPVQRNGVTLRQRNQQIVCATPVSIAGRGVIRVTFEVERAIRVPGNFALYAPLPADGIRIMFAGRYGHTLDVIAVHPNRDALRRPATNTWEFDYGILPWQGFQLRSSWS